MERNQDTSVEIFGDDTRLSEPTAHFVQTVGRLNDAFDTLEKYHGLLHVPAYLGVRRAFDHLAEAIKLAHLDQNEAASKEIEAISEALTISRADALRATVDFCHYRLLLVERKYPSEILYKFCPNFFSLTDDMDQANELVALEPKSLVANRDGLEWLESNYLPRLLAAYEQVSQAESAALEPETKNNVREKRFRALAIAGFLVGILGLAAGIFI